MVEEALVCLPLSGGVTFSGYDETFFALDTSTRRELWRANLGGRINAAPVTYSVSGKQFVSIAAGGAFYSFSESSLVAQTRRANSIRSPESDGPVELAR